MSRFIIFFILIFGNGIVETVLVEQELVQVLIVTGNGQRTPAGPFPKDPWTTLKTWPEGWKKLTANGSEQMKTLGEYLRNRYTLLLPTQYKTKDGLIRSSDTSYTLDSASALMSGLYPNQTVPVQVSPMDCDTIFYPNKNCPAFYHEMDIVSKLSETLLEEENYAPLYAWLTLKLDKEIRSLSKIYELYTNLVLEEQRGLKHPEWAEAVYPEPARSLAGKYVSISAISKSSRRLSFGPMLNDILKHSSEAGTNTSRRLFIYSADDTTIAGLLKTLKCYDGFPPGFAAALLFEVYKDSFTQKMEIRLYYKNESRSDLQKLYVPECGYSCTLTQLGHILTPYLPKNLQLECENIVELRKRFDISRMEVLTEKDRAFLALVFTSGVVVFGILSLFSIIFASCYFGRSENREQENITTNRKLMYELL
ncbi:prostatic acid phosphatase-like [Arctopsyche grandis]|uniref:prostatic acid phosphatase-like n=1 Tax=Arctopsyche grandis TaxID=121162 RepID=UPI00406D869A